MPSSTKALGVPKEERNDLGGWSAHGSDTCTRVAVRVISNLQRLVIRALIEQTNADPLAEEETITQFESFLCEKGVAPADLLGCLKQVGKVSITLTAGRDPRFGSGRSGADSRPKTMFPDEEPTVESAPEVTENRQAVQEREQSNSSLGGEPQGSSRTRKTFFGAGILLVSVRTKRYLDIYICLEVCYMVPGIDYIRYQFTGTSLCHQSQNLM